MRIMLELLVVGGVWPQLNRCSPLHFGLAVRVFGPLRLMVLGSPFSSGVFFQRVDFVEQSGLSGAKR